MTETGSAESLALIRSASKKYGYVMKYECYFYDFDEI